MRTSLPLIAVLFGGCEQESAAPFLETEYVRYSTVQPHAPCGGLAGDTDRKVEHLYDRLEEPYPPPRSIFYKWVADNSGLLCVENAAGCTRLGSEGPIIAALDLANSHELAHASHFSTLGYSHPLLSEGLATYYTGRYGLLSSDAKDTFAADIESILVEGEVLGRQYPLAAHFVGVTIERHGLDAFKEFWREVGFSTTLAEFRAAYESRYGEPWPAALATMAGQRQAAWFDLECEGEAQVVGAEGLHLVVPETCEDEGVFGPVRNDEAYAGDVRIPIELSTDGSYHFKFTHPGGADVAAATFRGCQLAGPALGAPITVFFPRDDHSVLLGAGRYLLSVRVPLTPSDAPVEAWIVPEG